MDDKELKMLISYCEDKLTLLYQRAINAKKRNPKNADWHDGFIEGARIMSGDIINYLKSLKEV